MMHIQTFLCPKSTIWKNAFIVTNKDPLKNMLEPNYSKAPSYTAPSYTDFAATRLWIGSKNFQATLISQSSTVFSRIYLYFPAKMKKISASFA